MAGLRDWPDLVNVDISMSSNMSDESMMVKVLDHQIKENVTLKFLQTNFFSGKKNIHVSEFKQEKKSGLAPPANPSFGKIFRHLKVKMLTQLLYQTSFHTSYTGVHMSHRCLL